MSYADGTTGEVMVAVAAAAPYPGTVEEAEEMLRGITCPVLVIEGTEDRCQPRGRFDTVARLTERRTARPRRLRAPADGPRPGAW